MTTPAIEKIRSIVERLPTPRDEDWKYTDLAGAREISARWLDAGANTPEASVQQSVDAMRQHPGQRSLQQRVGREHPVPAQGKSTDGEHGTAHVYQLQPLEGGRRHAANYSTVTDLARLRGLSTSVPFCTAT